LIRSFSLAFAAAVLTCSLGSAAAQVTPLDRQLSRIDIGISGAGELTRTVTGKVTPAAPSNTGTNLTVDASNTVGALLNIRYVAKPLVGFEFNYGYARFTENYSYPPPNFGVQANANEYTAGYLATPAHPIFGFQPFVSGGLGATAFKPTRGGGQGLINQTRMTYYYSVGVQNEVFGEHLGVRVSFRQLFYKAPDFGTNYLTINKQTITSQPTVGFYVKF
jgi:hypothetical protein